MLATIQFPIADSRFFLDEDTGKLNRPAWPAPLVDTDFVRSFGAVRQRWNGGLSGWIGERDICEARRALRFGPLVTLSCPDNPIAVSPKIVFRRFFSDGLAVNKVEVGIAFKLSGDVADLSFQASWLFKSLLELPVRIPTPGGGTKRYRLWESGGPLARLLMASSSRLGSAPIAKSDRWLVQNGRPIMLVEYKNQKRLVVPYHGREVNLSRYPEVMLSHHILPLYGINVRLWLLNRAQVTDLSAQRKLRITLLRLHAEKECLRRILTNIAAGNVQPAARSAASQVLQLYLNSATHRIFQLQGYAGSLENGPAGYDDLLPAFEAEEAINIGERDAILQTLAQLDVRKNISSKIEQLVVPCVSPDATTLAIVGLDGSGRDRVIEILARQAATTPPNPQTYFQDLIRRMGLPQLYLNEIIGVWTGNTNFDAAKLFDWAVCKGTMPDYSRPIVMALLQAMLLSLGGEDTEFVESIIAKSVAQSIR